ncbi:hypothetical protein TNCV_4007771 [Trichonephila clavipes]|nr:hypothetical protein TNCV_4007771 [Trichonephila clavipes]
MHISDAVNKREITEFALQSCRRVIDDGPRHFESRSSDEHNPWAESPLPTSAPHHFDILNMHRSLLHDESSSRTHGMPVTSPLP